MKGFVPLVLGIFGTFTFSWVGLILIPNLQIGHLDPQTDEEGTDIYPMPQSGMVERGRQVYQAAGCVYCHSRWVRADYAGADLDRKWGERRSAPRDYIFDRPVLLGKMRIGPGLSNVGQRAPAEEENAAPAASPSPGAVAPPAGPAASPPPATAAAPASSPAASPTVSATAQAPPYSAAWHYRHLYSPRSVMPESIMPAYRFLYDKRPITGQPSADALKLTGKDAPPEGWEIVPTYDAQCLVAFLISSNQSHPLNEAKPGFAAQKAPAPASSPS